MEVERFDPEALGFRSDQEEIDPESGICTEYAPFELYILMYELPGKLPLNYAPNLENIPHFQCTKMKGASGKYSHHMNPYAPFMLH